MPAVSMAYLLVMHYDVQYTKYFNLNAEFILVSHAFWFRLHKSFIELFFFVGRPAFQSIGETSRMNTGVGKAFWFHVMFLKCLGWVQGCVIRRFCTMYSQSL